MVNYHSTLKSDESSGFVYDGSVRMVVMFPSSGGLSDSGGRRSVMS